MTEIDTITETDPIWPLDVAKLAKGQVIGETECEEIVGIKSTHPRYPFELMGLREFIMSETGRTGAALSVAIRGNSLVINTDAQASMYHARLAKMGERAVHRNFYHLAKTVDTGKLTAQERADHDRRIAIWAMKSARLKSGSGQLPHSQAANIEGSES